MHDVSPVKLIGNVTKSRGYFYNARWKGSRRCIKCNYKIIYYFDKVRVIDVKDGDTNLMISPVSILENLIIQQI